MSDNQIKDNIKKLLAKSLNEVITTTNYTALEVIITKLRNGVLNDKYEKREQREYLKILTDWIKLNNERDKQNNNINYFQGITIK